MFSRVPISPENRARYPADWQQISHRIRFVRAEGRCECHGECGQDHGGRCQALHSEPHPITGSIVVLTTAHRHHAEIEDCGDDDLFAACQRCHNAYDRPMRQINAAATRARKAEAAQDRRVMQAECMAFALECATGQRWPRIRPHSAKNIADEG